jgi:hypothetical protein
MVIESAASEAARSRTRGWWLGAQRSGLSPWECRAAQSREARREEAQEPSWGTAKATTLSVLPCRQLPLGVACGDRGADALARVVLHRQPAQPARRNLPAVAWTLLLGGTATAAAAAAAAAAAHRAAGARCHWRYGDGQEAPSSCGCGRRSCCGGLGRSRFRE